jgi:hypothetical protein
MILYPQPVKNQPDLCSLGMVGETQVFRASLDLEASDLGAEEGAFGAAIIKEIINKSA